LAELETCNWYSKPVADAQWICVPDSMVRGTAPGHKSVSADAESATVAIPDREGFMSSAGKED